MGSVIGVRSTGLIFSKIDSIIDVKVVETVTSFLAVYQALVDIMTPQMTVVLLYLTEVLVGLFDLFDNSCIYPCP